MNNGLFYKDKTKKVNIIDAFFYAITATGVPETNIGKFIRIIHYLTFLFLGMVTIEKVFKGETTLTEGIEILEN